LISLDDRNSEKEKNEYTINKEKQGNKYMIYYTLVKNQKVGTSLVVIRPEQFTEWETELKKTNLSYFTAVKQVDIDIEDYDIILCSSKLFNYFCTLWSNIQWKRVVFDNPMSLTLKKQSLPFSDFYWFMTPSPHDLLSKKCPSFFEPMFDSIDYDLLKNVVVKNNDDYVHDSFSMPKTTHIIHYYTHNIANALKGLVSNCVMELIHSGNYETAMRYLNSDKQEKYDDLLSLLKNKNETMYDTVVKRLCDSVCPICTDCIQSPVLFTCCYNVYCDKCITDWIHIKK